MNACRSPLSSVARFSPVEWSWIPILVIAFALYWPLRNAAFLNYDDPLYITQNPYVLQGLTKQTLQWAFSSEPAFFHPLTWLSLSLDVQLFGLNPRASHMVNVWIHAASALALLSLLLKFFSPWSALLGCIIWLAHPLNIETVAWVTERKGLLCGFFTILSVNSYVRAIRGDSGCFYLFSLLWWIFAILSKPAFVAGSIALIVLSLYEMGHAKGDRLLRAIKLTLPFHCIGLIAVAATLISQRGAGASVTLEAAPITFRIANSLVATVFYLTSFGAPVNSAIVYPRPLWWEPSAVLTCLVIVALSGYTVAKYRHRFPHFWIGIVWWIAGILPVVGFSLVGPHWAADRYMYLPGIGLVWCLLEILRHRPKLTAPVVLWCGILILFTGSQIHFWRDSESIWRLCLSRTENNSTAENNLGVTLMNKDQEAEAIQQYKRALGCNPNFAQAAYNLYLNAALIGSHGKAIRYRELVPREFLREQNDVEARFLN